MVAGRPKPKSLKTGRPPLSRFQQASLSSKATRGIIRSHHTLQKDLARALKEGDETQAAKLKAELEASGGLKSYQLASTLGQSIERGGDTSKVLVEWLQLDFEDAREQGRRLRLLEVGALSTKNACSSVDCLDVVRIDLQSNDPGIQQLDFMEMSIPETEEAQYDMVSLSLVLNYVPTAKGRGDMLKRVSSFFRSDYVRKLGRDSGEGGGTMPTPCLFVVLPLPCLTNSRYLDVTRLRELMKSLGFDVVNTKTTTKLYYELYMYAAPLPEANSTTKKTAFRKEELKKGATRNNFAIILEARHDIVGDNG